MIHKIVLTNVFNKWGVGQTYLDSDLFHFCFPPSDVSFMFYVCVFFCCFCSACFSQGASVTVNLSGACHETPKPHQLIQLSKWLLTTCLMELGGVSSKRVSGQLTWVEFPCHLVLAHFAPWNRTNMLSNDLE